MESSCWGCAASAGPISPIREASLLLLCNRHTMQRAMHPCSTQSHLEVHGVAFQGDIAGHVGHVSHRVKLRTDGETAVSLRTFGSSVFPQRWRHILMLQHCAETHRYVRAAPTTDLGAQSHGCLPRPQPA